MTEVMDAFLKEIQLKHTRIEAHKPTTEKPPRTTKGERTIYMDMLEDLLPLCLLGNLGKVMGIVDV